MEVRNITNVLFLYNVKSYRGILIQFTYLPGDLPKKGVCLTHREWW